MSTSQAAVFVATAVTAGLLSQWPMGWLSDRINRAGLIRFNALLLAVLPALMWGWIELPFWAMLALSAVFGVLHSRCTRWARPSPTTMWNPSGASACRRCC